MECSKDATIYQEFLEKERLFDFLAGLNGEFDQVRVQILGRDPLPSLNEAFAIVRGEEGWRNVMLKTFDSVDGSTLSISKSSVNDGVMTTTIAAANAANSRRTEGRKPSEKDSLWCSYCRKNRHTRETAGSYMASLQISLEKIMAVGEEIQLEKPEVLVILPKQSVVVERKIFQVKSEDYNGGKWLSITERSRGFVVSLDFGEEETGWLVEQLEKAVELEDSRGYIRKMRGKTRTHMMEICFNSRGCYMKITEYSAKRKPLVLVVPRGVNGCGWENLRKVIASVQELSVQVGRESKETQNKLQESKGMYRGERTYAEVVAEKGTRNGAGMPVGKWARAVVCEGKGEIRDWCEVGKAIARRVGMKGMVSVTPISAYKGCFFVENARKAQWFQERGSFTVRGEVFALRRWSPEENSVVRGKFRRGWLELRGLPFHLWDEVQLSHILQQWGRVTKVARNSLKFVDLSKVTLRVEMLPKVVLPALLEVEDGDWTYTVAVTVTGEDDGEDDGGDSIKPESSRSKDELRSAGGCVLQKPQMVEGLRAIDRTSDCQRWMPVIVSILALQIQNRLRGRKEREVGAKDFGPIAGPAHKGSSNGGPAVSSSSKLQRPGLSAKNKASEGLPQVSSKTKGSPVSVRRRARSGPPRFDEASSSPKRSFEGGGSLETNRDISRGKSHSRKSDFSTVWKHPKFPPGETEGEEGILQCKLINEVRNPISAVSERDLPLSGAFESDSIPETSVSLGHPFLCPPFFFVSVGVKPRFSAVDLFLSLLWCMITIVGGASCSKGVVVPLETSNQKSKGPTFPLGKFPSNLEVRGDSGEALFPGKNLSLSRWEGVVGENRNPLSADKVYSRRKKKRILELEERISSDAGCVGFDCSHEDFKLEYKRRLVSSIWKGKSLDWVALPACGASGGIVILWDSVKFNCSEKCGGRTFGWNFKIYMGLTFPRWCVGGDFNVIRRISEKMGDSRLTINMRRFDEL
ncbi:hypothetical protein CK203_105775 [Vitis vinifera]|uniref:Uncharacterized protein n=1 Tax=Vitis vinifera TaxID=29760 RepID=A0A438D2J9_VITVI|nr:hypothetical protein CK203_105775 [Vitis vinifera]